MNPRIVVAGIVIVLVVAFFILSPTLRPGAPEGAWGELTSGDPAATARNMVGNGDFSDTRLIGWSQSKTVELQPHAIPEGESAPGAGRGGTGGFHLGPADARRARVCAAWPLADLRHFDYYFDGFARFESRRGKTWVGIEFTLEGSDGQPVATYLAWKGSPGVAAPVRAKGLVEEMQPSDGGWWRVPTRTTAELKGKGLALAEPAYALTVRLWLDLDEAEADVWFDDVKVLDMKAGR
ncbi:MAG: hypothetical protein HYY18_21285 [Planctomycetes bacterium]|nr:hypothetical protein [Planctomycetota bacterium]